jgi:hypothetical protein
MRRCFTRRGVQNIWDIFYKNELRNANCNKIVKSAQRFSPDPAGETRATRKKLQKTIKFRFSGKRRIPVHSSTWIRDTGGLLRQKKGDNFYMKKRFEVPEEVCSSPP